MLEKLVDSMTCKLFPATKIDVDPVLDRPGWIKIKEKTIQIVRDPKNAEKNEDNRRFDSEMLVFCDTKWRVSGWPPPWPAISAATGRQAEPNTQTSPENTP